MTPDVRSANAMEEPPKELDGARVLLWAWSGDEPFGFMGPFEIFGLAICTYDEKQFYRFSCDRNWEVQNDGVYNSTESAMNQLPDQYKQVPADWKRR